MSELIEKLKPLWEPASGFHPAGMADGCDFSREVNVALSALEAKDHLGGFSYESRLAQENAIFGLFLKHALKVLGISQGELAERLGVSREQLNRLGKGAHAAPHTLYVALYREVIAEALLAWVDSWVDEKAREAFVSAVVGVQFETAWGHGFTDRFTRYVHALGVVCGQDGWATFWNAVGSHIPAPGSYDNSAQFFAQRVKEAKRRAGGTIPEEGE